MVLLFLYICKYLLENQSKLKHKHRSSKGYKAGKNYYDAKDLCLNAHNSNSKIVSLKEQFL